MIYLTDGNMPLNNAYSDKIVQEANNMYQLSFRFPTSDPLWEMLKEETFLIADDLHGEQDFVIFEVEKKQGYIQIYANQVFTLLNNFVTGPISLDRVTGTTAVSRFAGAITRDNPFSFFSDISERHTFNTETKNAMQVFAKDKHSILGQWGGDLVRHGYQVRLLKNGGSENESLFMYKKNLSSYQHKTSTKSLKTRITFKTTVKGEGENAPDRKFSVVVDSPLINKYSQIYEDVIEVNSQDVKDEASLRTYGEQYFKTSLCDMMEDSLELEVVGQSDVPVQMFDIVSLFYEVYNLDVRKKITKYTYSPMAEKLIAIGFGQFKSGLANAIGNVVSDAVNAEAQQLHDDFEKQLERELKNADLAFEHQKEELVNQFTDGLNAAKAKAEEVKAAMTDQLNLKINQSKSEVTDRLQKEFDQKLSIASTDLAAVRANMTQAQSRLSGDISQIQSDIAAIRGKQSQADNELAKQVQSINQAKSDLAGVKTNLTQAQSQLNSNISQIRSDVGNIRTKQGQHETEIGKQVQALNAAKTELASVKSAQATYEQTTTRRLAELANVADGKASKSELTQTAEELKSRIASVQASGRNLFLNSLFKQDIRKTGIWTTSTYEATIDSENKYLGHNALKIVGQNPSGRDGGNPKITYPAIGQYGKVVPGSMTNQDVTISFYAKAEKAGTILRSRLGNIGFKDGNVTLTTEVKRYVVKLPKNWTGSSPATTNEWLFNLNRADTVWIWMPKFEVSDTDTPYSEAPEDVESQISAVESSFKQRADSLEAGVNRLTEGLKTKADSSALTVLSDSIKQSVKSLETNMDNKLDSKLSTAVFEVRASGIRQEILNATKDKADKALITAEAGKLREELASVQASGRNLFLNSLFKQDIGKAGIWTTSTYTATIDSESKYLGHNALKIVGQDPTGRGDNVPKITYPAIGQYGKVAPGSMSNQDVTISFYAKAEKAGTILRSRLGNIGFKDGNVTLTTEVKRYVVKLPKNWTGLSPLTTNEWLFNLDRADTVWIWMPKFEVNDADTPYSEAPEDVERLITEAKAVFERTAQGLRTDLSAVQAYVNSDSTRAEALRTYSREETARQLTAERKLIEAGYVGKAQHTEDVRGLTRRFEELTVGGRNLALGTSKEWSTPFTNFSGNPNIWFPLYKVLTDGLQVGDTLRSKIILKYTDVRPATGKTATVWLQGNGNVTNWTAGAYNSSPAKTLNGSGEITFEHSFKITENHLKNAYWNWAFRTDFIASGSLQWRLAKVESGSVYTSWSPAPEDATAYADTKLAEYKQGIDGQLASVQAAINTANGSLTAFNTWKQSAQETLNKVGRVETGLKETKTSLAEFKQRADSLEAGVTRLTEGLKTKADNSALNLLSDRILASVRSLETDTQNKLDQKLSTAEFEVRAGSIRQEILNATKDKADKSLVTAEAGRLREELASLSVGGRNLALGTSKEWSTPFTNFSGNPNICPQLYKVLTDGLQVGDTLRSRVILKYTDVRPATGKTATVWLQGNGNVTGWAAGDYNDSPAKNLNGSGEITFEHSFKITENHLKNAYWNWMFRTDFIASGSLQWRLAKVESGSVFTSWSPAPEDAEGLITESKAVFERTAQGLRTDLTAVQSYVSADGTRSEALRTYSREETARQLTTLRQSLESGYVAKAEHAEDVRGLTRRFEELKTSSDTKFAQFKQGIDGQFATMSSQIGESLKKTDISITPGQITLGTGKVVNGQTLASLFVQNPESMQAITKLMRITGDLIVDGSITGRDLAAGAITTPHLAAGSVTAEVLGVNAVTADKVKADDALLEKLSAGEALIRKLMAKDAFINRLQSIDFTAEQVKGGMIKALNGALKIDLNNGQYNVMTDQAAIRRVLSGYPNQFLKFTSETEGGAPASVTVLGANRDGTENSKNDSFAGIRLFSGNKVERTEIISDVVRFATGAVNYRGWEMRTLYGNDNRQVILQPFGNVTRSNIVANYFNGIDIVNVLETLNQMMANLGNHTGRHDIFGPIRGLGARKYAR